MSPGLAPFRALVRKDLVSFLRDRRALLVNIVTPIFIAAFFGFLFGGSGETAGITGVPVALIDNDGSALSKAVIADLQQETALETTQPREAEARDLVKRGKLNAVVILPEGFGVAAARALFGGRNKPTIELLFDPSQGLVRPVVEGLLTQHIMQEVTGALFATGGSTGTARGLTLPYSLDSQAISTGPHYNSYAHSFAGMSVQFTLFMGIDAGIALLLMRQQGMWRRLRAAPLSHGVLLGSRVASTALISLFILCIVYFAACLIFGVRINGSWLGFVGVAVAFACLAATTGLMIAALGRSASATRGISLFLVLLLVMLGGAWVPASLFPTWLQHVSQLAPTRWAVDGFDAMTWRGLPLHAALLPITILLSWSLFFGLIAVWRFDWEAG